MKIQAAFLCDAANIREGLLNVLSAGITRRWVKAVPAELGVAAALLVTIPQDAAALPHQVSAEVLDPDENRVTQVVGAFQLDPNPKIETGEDYVVPFVVDLHSVQGPKLGRYQVRIHIDEELPVVLLLYLLHRDEIGLPGLR